MKTILVDHDIEGQVLILWGAADRLRESAYRERCVVRLIEIALEIARYLGAGRLFIP